MSQSTLHAVLDASETREAFTPPADSKVDSRLATFGYLQTISTIDGNLELLIDLWKELPKATRGDLVKQNLEQMAKVAMSLKANLDRLLAANK